MVRGGVALVTSLILALGMTAGAVAQGKQDDNEGYLIAFACGELSPPLMVEIETLDDSTPALRLRNALIEIMQERKAVFSMTAPMRLTLEMETLREAEQRKGRDLGEFTARPGDEGEDIRLRMNLWSNERDSLIGGRKERLEQRGVDEVRVTVAIHSKSDGKCLWQGEAIHQLNGRDAVETSIKLLPHLADAVGKTLKKQAIELE